MSRSKDIQMARYLAGEMTMKDEIAFLGEFEQHQEQLSDLKNMEKNWKYFDQNPSRKDWDSGKAWSRLRKVSWMIRRRGWFGADSLPCSG